MKIQIDGHLIDTEMIVAVTKPSYSDHEFEIMLLGRQTITIKRTKHQDMYRHITTDMQARMTPEERIKDDQRHRDMEEHQSPYRGDLQPDRRLLRVHRRLPYAWRW